VISHGFWPGDRRFKHAAFYSYTAPAPAGLAGQTVRPSAAFWNNELENFILKYDDVRTAPSPDDVVLEFCQSTYEAGANLANWQRDVLERRAV
jgi:hypothetical protein